MKFGKNLARNQVPEWGTYYINYKALKKVITSIILASRQRQDPLDETDPTIASFSYLLDRNLETVQDFYSKRISEASRLIKLIQERYPLDPIRHDRNVINKDELNDLIITLLDLRGQLRKLQWFTEVNKQGFLKILKKFDKKTGLCMKEKYLNSKVAMLPFVSGTEIISDLNVVSDYLAVLSPKQEEAEQNPHISSLKLGHGSTALTDEALDGLTAIINEDDVTRLTVIIDALKLSNRLIVSFLRQSIEADSRQCIKALLERSTSLEDSSDIYGRNIFHRLVIGLGRKSAHTFSVAANPKQFIVPAEAPVVHLENGRNIRGGDNVADGFDQLVFVLENLPAHLAKYLDQIDSHKRTPLHYAALYGLKAVTIDLLVYLKRFVLYRPLSEDNPTLEVTDSEGMSPLQLAVRGKHPLTTKALLSADDLPPHDSQQLLYIGVSGGSLSLMEELLNAGLNVDYQNEDTGETPLYLATKLGMTDMVKLLVEKNASLDIVESNFGWTPLFAAAAEGNNDIVNVLYEICKDDLQRVDYSGWTAMEHACLRGHLNIARKLKTAITSPSFSPMQSGSASSSNVSLDLDANNSDSTPSMNSSVTTEPIKSYGHPYLLQNSLILITLGTTDTRSDVKPVVLDKVPYSEAHATQLDQALTLSVSAAKAEGEPVLLDLPFKDSIVTELISFQAKDPSEVVIFFDILPTYSVNMKQLPLGRAVVLLSSVNPKIGKSYRSLHQTLTTPIVRADTLEPLGIINFEVQVVQPFHHPDLSIAKSPSYWKSLITTRVIGHRGLGKNTTNNRSLQLGENTIDSFIAAANLGASYVEFDVQLTKDMVPVIYHDFLVGETGIDAPMRSLTLEQFLNSSGHSKREHVMSRKKDRHLSDEKAPRRPRSLSLDSDPEDLESGADRMKYTRDFKIKGFKGNSRGISIHSPFTTLQEVFKTLPTHVGFNIECKYPMLDESQAEEMDNLVIDMDSWVNTVLKCVYDHGKGRDIIFSSFNPDICMMLSLKQPSVPILFLTESGTEPMADIRARSLQEAIRFAKRWNLLGIVSACEPLILCPRLVEVVKTSGLVCVTYGVMNNDPASVRIQMKHGVDAVIVDSVLAVRQGLTIDGARP